MRKIILFLFSFTLLTPSISGAASVSSDGNCITTTFKKNKYCVGECVHYVESKRVYGSDSWHSVIIGYEVFGKGIGRIRSINKQGKYAIVDVHMRNYGYPKQFPEGYPFRDRKKSRFYRETEPKELFKKEQIEDGLQNAHLRCLFK